MNVWLRIFALVALLIANGSAWAQSRSLLLSIAPGYTGLDQFQNCVGATCDMILIMEERLGEKFERRYQPPSRNFQDFIDGNGDVFPFFADPRMQSFGVESEAIAVIPQVAVTLKDKPLYGFDDLYSVGMVAIVRGGVPFGPLLEDPKIKRLEIPDVNIGLRMLVDRRVQTVVASKVGLMTALREHKMESWVTWVQVGELKLVFYLNPRLRGSEFSEKLFEVLRGMRNDGTVAKIFDRHFGPFWREGS